MTNAIDTLKTEMTPSQIAAEIRGMAATLGIRFDDLADEQLVSKMRGLVKSGEAERLRKED